MRLFRATDDLHIIYWTPVWVFLIVFLYKSTIHWYLLPTGIAIMSISLLPSKYFPDFIRFKKVNKEDYIFLCVVGATSIGVLFDTSLWYPALVILEICIITSYWILRHATKPVVVISSHNCQQKHDRIELPEDFRVNNEACIYYGQKAPVKISNNKGETFVVNGRPVIFGDTLLEVSNQAKVYYL